MFLYSADPDDLVIQKTCISQYSYIEILFIFKIGHNFMLKILAYLINDIPYVFPQVL